MDLNSFKNNVKQDIKAEVTPGKLLRTAFIPQTKGLLNPIKDVFGVFVLVIVQLFVQAKLVPADHPAALKQITGFNAIWAVILDGSTGLKFRRENLYQIIVFYGVVGMLIFGVLDFLFFLTHFSMGQAHAQVVNNTGSLFAESNANDMAPQWINNIFPYQNAAPASAGLPYAMQGMLVIYNSALLALGTVLALYQIVTLFMESAHHGTYGGNRYSQLYAPLRLVMGIGLLIPFSYGYNAAEIIAIDMAQMGSGLASNVWQAFLTDLTVQGEPQLLPPSNVNEILQKLVVDETCMVAAQYTQGNAENPGNTNAPNWIADQESETTSLLTIPGNDSDTSAQSFTIHFDNQPGDGFCGTLTIPAQQSSLGTMGTNPSAGLSGVNYVEQAFVCPGGGGGNGSATTSTNCQSTAPGNASSGGYGILTDIWWIAVAIYNNSSNAGSTSNPGNYDPTANVFCISKTGGCAPSYSSGWGTGTPATPNTKYEDWANFAGMLQSNTSSTNATTGVTTPNADVCTTPVPGTNPGFIPSSCTTTANNEMNALFLAEEETWVQYETQVACYGKAGGSQTDQYGIVHQGPCLQNGDWTQAGYLFLQISHNAEDLYVVEHPDIQVSLPDPSVMVDPSKLQCPSGWSSLFSTPPYACTTAGLTVVSAVWQAVGDVNTAAKYDGMTPVAFIPNSNGNGNDGSKINSAIAGGLSVIQPGESMFNLNNGGPTFGQSIFNVMQIGNLLLIAAGVMYITAAALGNMFTPVLGGEIAMFASLLLPIGFSLSVMIPLLPAGRFLFGIFTWLLTLFEAMVTMPLVALVSIKSDGDGLFAHGMQGWLMLLQMMMRPALMIFGLLGGVVIFDTLAGFINTTVFGAMTAMQHSGTTGQISAFLGKVGFLYFYVLTIYALANLSFGMINMIPDRVLQWIGSGGIGNMDMAMNGLGQEAASSASRTTDQIGSSTGRVIRDREITVARNQEKIENKKAAIEAGETAEKRHYELLLPMRETARGVGAIEQNTANMSSQNLPGPPSGGGGGGGGGGPPPPPPGGGGGGGGNANNVGGGPGTGGGNPPGGGGNPPGGGGNPPGGGGNPPGGGGNPPGGGNQNNNLINKS